MTSTLTILMPTRLPHSIHCKMAASNLISAGLIETDVNNDILWVWSYPSITEEKQLMCLRKCGLKSLADLQTKYFPSFLYFHFHNHWYYISNTTVSNNEKLPKVKHVSVVLVAKLFHPEKFEALSIILQKAYCKTGDPTSMLKNYLSVLTCGSCNAEENGTFTDNDFSVKQAYVQGSLRDVINTFGIESILIYSAIILKKRVAVYHHQVEELLKFIRSFPSFSWHRQNWNILYPYVDIAEEDALNSTAGSHYVAGFIDAAVERRTDLFDLFVNIPAVEVTVAQHAKESFTMTKLHKEIAVLMTNSASDTDNKTEQQVIMDVAMKTKELLNNIRSIAAGSEQLTLEMIRERQFPAAIENFLFGVAVAEGIIQL